MENLTRTSFPRAIQLSCSFIRRFAAAIPGFRKTIPRFP